MAVAHTAATLFEAVSGPFRIGTLALTVRPSIGIAMYAGDGTTANALLKAADSAKHGAKRTKTTHTFSERAYVGPHSDIGAAP